MFWSYNIVKTEDGYGLYEVYFYGKWDIPFMRTEEPIIFDESVDEIRRTIKMMYEDSKKNPILNDEDIR